MMKISNSAMVNILLTHLHLDMIRLFDKHLKICLIFSFFYFSFMRKFPYKIFYLRLQTFKTKHNIMNRNAWGMLQYSK